MLYVELINVFLLELRFLMQSQNVTIIETQTEKYCFS